MARTKREARRNLLTTLRRKSKGYKSPRAQFSPTTEAGTAAEQATRTHTGIIAKSHKRRRFHPGVVALREIRKLQRTTENLIPRASFERLVREIAQRIAPDLRFQRSAISALQEASESYVICAFHPSFPRCLIHFATRSADGRREPVRHPHTAHNPLPVRHTASTPHPGRDRVTKRLQEGQTEALYNDQPSLTIPATGS